CCCSSFMAAITHATVIHLCEGSTNTRINADGVTNILAMLINVHCMLIDRQWHHFSHWICLVRNTPTTGNCAALCCARLNEQEFDRTLSHTTNQSNAIPIEY